MFPIGTWEKFGAASGTVNDTEVVQVDVYARDAITVDTYAGDAVSLMGPYRNDNEVNTQWVDIWPDTVDDVTAQSPARGVGIIEPA